MRPISDAFRKAIQDPSSTEVALLLLSIEHPNLPVPIRLVLDHKPVTSRGLDFAPFAFAVDLPDETPDRPPRAVLRVDNVDRAIVAALVSQELPPEAKLEIVTATDPDNVEFQTIRMEWRQVRWTGTALEGDLEGPSVLNRRIPHYVFNPQTAPGLFRGGL